jgi:hypothetical protein
VRADPPVFRLSLCTRADPSKRLLAFVAAARAEAELQGLETGKSPCRIAAQSGQLRHDQRS